MHWQDKSVQFYDGHNRPPKVRIVFANATEPVVDTFSFHYDFVIGDRFTKKGQMRWTNAGANALLHIRIADLNGELADIFKKPLYVKPSNVPQEKLWEEFRMTA